MVDEQTSKENGSTDLVVRPPTSATTGTPAMLDIPVDCIHESSFWHRRNYERNLDSLAESIDKHGLLQAPAVMPKGDGQYELVYGHQRFYSCKRLGRKSIICRVLNITEKEAGILSYRENHDRYDIHPLDRAKHLKQLKDMHGWTDEQLAEAVGLSQSSVTEYLGLLDLSQEIQSSIENGQENSISLTAAVLLSRIVHSARPNHEFEISELRNKVQRHRIPAAELRGLVRLFTSGEYDRLPRTLRMQLLHNSGMTASVASIYLHPEDVVTGEGEQGDQVRNTARSLTSDELESLIVNAVRTGLNPAQIRARVLALAHKRMSSATDKSSLPRSAYDDVMHSLSELLNGIRPACNQVLESVPDRPELVVGLYHALDNVLTLIAPLMQSLNEAVIQIDPDKANKQEISHV